MISKNNRLSEREVRKVLQKGKPFFSYGIVLNYAKNRLGYNRFAIVLGAKSIPTNVQRNFFRRRFYDQVAKYVGSEETSQSCDFVFVVKKQTKLDKKKEDSLQNFKKDIGFLIEKGIK